MVRDSGLERGAELPDEVPPDAPQSDEQVVGIVVVETLTFGDPVLPAEIVTVREKLLP
jgi:hypothetical protein